jgi:vacuolar protein sorting-associated protein 35
VSLLDKYFDSTGSAKTLTGTGADKVVDLLSSPLKTFSLQVLDMEQYPVLLGYLKFDTRKTFALNVVQIVVDENIPLTSPDSVESLFGFLEVLVKDVSDTPKEQKDDKVTFAHEQRELTKLVHQIKADTLDDRFVMLTTVRKYFSSGGNTRMCYTLPSVTYSALSLIDQIDAENAKRVELANQETPEEDLPAPLQITHKKVFQFVHKTTTVINSIAPEAALQLWLTSAQLANRMEAKDPGRYEEICNEFCTQALVVFEDEFSDSKKQYEGVLQLAGTVSMLDTLEEENQASLKEKIVKFSLKLLKKPLQCRAIASCAPMYGKPQPNRALECLQKCLKICDSTVQQDPKIVGLWPEMLDMYVYCYQQNILDEEKGPNYINSLMQLCQEHIDFSKNTPEAKEEGLKAQNHYNSTLSYMKFLKQQDKDNKYAAMNL